MSDAVISADGSEMTPLENYILRLDAEANGNYRISDEEAVSLVLSFASGGVGSSSDIQTLSANEINIKDIKPLRDQPMMFIDDDYRAPVLPLAIKFDSPEGEGIAVCSGDRRYEKIFCYVPKGDLSDTLKIDMIRHFYRSVERNIIDSVARFNAQIDSLHALGRSATYAYSVCPEHNTGLQDGMFCMGEEYTELSKGENYIELKLKWKQEYPYNKFMEQRADNSAYTSQGKVILGCVPVALGQAIAFKKYDYLTTISAKWDAINNIEDITGTQYEDIVAQYLSDLAYRLRINITPTGTNSKEWKMLKYLDSVKNIHKINFEHIEKPRYATIQEKDVLMNYFSDAVQKKIL